MLMRFSERDGMHQLVVTERPDGRFRTGARLSPSGRRPRLGGDDAVLSHYNTAKAPQSGIGEKLSHSPPMRLKLSTPDVVAWLIEENKPDFFH